MSPEQKLRANLIEQAHHYAVDPQRAVAIAHDFERFVIAGIPPRRHVEEGDMSDETLTAIATRFCSTPLPASVCVDLCATTPGDGRCGTNLLTVAEATEMFRHVFAKAFLVSPRVS